MVGGILKSAASLPIALSMLAGPTEAFWRLPCRSRTGLGRIDPLVDPGIVSDHSHAIHGGGNFGFDTTYEDLMASDCTSCEVTQDKSAYWTPSLHFMYPNGTTVVVNQVGGMLAYYLLYGDNLKAFPAGFRMLAGDTNQRNFTLPVPDPPKSTWTGKETTQFALMQKAIGFNCLDYSKAPEGSLYRHFMPTKDYLDANCVDGLRLELMFPSCWNGKDLDSDDHRSHMAYPTLVMDGTCPEGFDVRVPSLFYETIWDTYAFAGVDGQFVLANGDPTGYGYHGDFIAGWDSDFLQQAVDTCTSESGEIQDCPLFDIQSDSDAAQCTFKMPSQLVDDDCAGPRDGLCGNVPIQSGPGYATGGHGGSSPTPTGYDTKTTDAPTTTASQVVPTLSYSSGTKKATDKYGGGITIARFKTSSTSPTATTTPPAAATDGVDGSIVSTTLYTSGGAAYEIFFEEVEVTVTATVPPTPSPAKHKRHVHHLHHHHAGGLA